MNHQPAPYLREISRQLLADLLQGAPDIPRRTSPPGSDNLRPPPPYLTEAEIARICHPLVQPAAQIRHLRRMGMHVMPSRDGRPVVARAEWERAMMGNRPAVAANDPADGSQPDAAALRALLQKRRRNGTKTKAE